MVFHLLLVPYTKVEESFNLQAMHDILLLKGDVVQYDHMEFPGVVPRSCIGAALVALVAYPAYLLHVSLNLQKQVLLYVVRLILGVTCWLSMCGIQKAVQQCLGVTCASAFMLLCAIQFHLPFYMSRTLPNTFATAVLGFALADWVTGAHPRRLICLLAFSTVSPGQLLTDTACRYLKICILCCIYAVTPVYRTATVCRCYQPTGETIHGNSVFIIKSL